MGIDVSDGCRCFVEKVVEILSKLCIKRYCAGMATTSWHGATRQLGRQAPKRAITQLQDTMRVNGDAWIRILGCHWQKWCRIAEVKRGFWLHVA